MMMLDEDQIFFRSVSSTLDVEDYSHQIAEIIGLRNKSSFIQAGCLGIRTELPPKKLPLLPRGPPVMTLILGPPGSEKTTLLKALIGKLDEDMKVTYCEMLVELSRREKEAGIKLDPKIDAFMKATALVGQETSLITDYVLKIIGLDICADIMVGDNMRRGISGGQNNLFTAIFGN